MKNSGWMTCQKSSGEVVLPRVRVGGQFFDRLRGYMFYHKPPYEALLLFPCQSIHTFFMHFPLHAVFMNSKNEVVRVYEQIPPWRVTGINFKSHKVLEIPCKQGDVSPIQVGDKLSFKEEICTNL